jgi:hypothetical protein
MDTALPERGSTLSLSGAFKKSPARAQARSVVERDVPAFGSSGEVGPEENVDCVARRVEGARGEQI